MKKANWVKDGKVLICSNCKHIITENKILPVPKRCSVCRHQMGNAAELEKEYENEQN